LKARILTELQKTAGIIERMLASDAVAETISTIADRCQTATNFCSLGTAAVQRMRSISQESL